MAHRECGAYRDLSDTYRAALARAGNPRKTKTFGGGDGVEMSSLMEEGRGGGPPWMVIVDGVKQIITKLNINLEKLTKAQETQLKGGDNLFDVDEESAQQGEVDMLNKTIGDLFIKANKNVKRIHDVNENAETSVGTQEDRKVRKNIQMALAGDLQDLSSKFRKKHKEFIRVKQQQKARVDESWKDFVVPEDDDDADADMGWSDAQLAEVETMGRIIEERDQEIQKIAKSVSDLANLFRELSALVIDSGTILDRIDYNMEEVVAN